MPSRERARDRGQRIAEREWARLGCELRDERLTAGLSQMHVATVAGLTQSRISRTERGRRLPPRLDELGRHAAALGLRLSVKVYPEGLPVRDAAQLRLLQRFREQLHESLGWKPEVMIGASGDQRAWDAVVFGSERVGVDAETRLYDIQALQRKTESKWRDSGVERVVLLVASTHHNRAVLREHRQTLASTFPLGTAPVMRALRAGRAIGSNGIVVL
jgi:transcriptional regulator with XRE-family HTH domain